MKISLFFIAALFLATAVAAQSTDKPTGAHARKFHGGISFNNSWAKFSDLGDSAFFHPVVGGHLLTEYFVTQWLGISVGLGVQQRGMGVYTPDLDQSVGNPDSTGRLRYKITTFELPVQLLYRHPQQLFKGGRIVAGVGIVPMYHFRAARVWKSIDDGFHEPQDIKGSYTTIDIPLHFKLGLDILAPGGTIFRPGMVMDYGLNPVYTNPVTGVRSNKHLLIGIQLDVLF